MEDLRRTGSLRVKKGSHTILARARSEGLPIFDEAPLELPQRSYTPLPNLPPMRPRSAWNFEDDTDSTTSSETMTSVSDDVPIGSSQLYYTTPPKTNMVRNQDDKSIGFHKVTRCLSQKDRIKNDVLQERQRSVSLDCGDGRTIKIFMSQNNDTSPSRDTPAGLLPSPSAPAQLRNMNGYQSSHRGSKILVSAKKRGSTSSDTDILSPHKMYERRRSDRGKLSGDASSLFEVVEQQDIDSVKAILESHTVNVNR
ncbi:unnamed protein product [Mytilus edulis]|uniref:Uncharacterized protein n=1 Tax=Mytilus edulis TaxID=6550 RepID=A0A8S3RP39_MYTED|nr:unnamed protein product [Mytilus edulis]